MNFKNYFLNLLSTLFFIFLLFTFYSTNFYFQDFFNVSYHLEIQKLGINIEQIEYKTILKYFIFVYILLLGIFYLFLNEKSKARIVIYYLFRKIKGDKKEITFEEKNSILAWLVKGFFAPLMIMWVTGHIFNLLNQGFDSYANIDLISEKFLYFFNAYFFIFAFSVILFFDVFFFTLGYLIEGKFFKNKIRSVEPTLLGWIVAIMCYPPFNNLTNNYFGWYSNDFAKIYNENISLLYNNFGISIHIFLNILILILMAIYSRASISLGLKASNLTNRGIVKTGPYKYIRHPAYICKNLSWWIGGIPFVLIAIEKTINNIKNYDFILSKTGILYDIFYNTYHFLIILLNDIKYILMIILSLLFRSIIYYLRAITEEKHLSKDKDYLEYKKQVPYKFIPGIK